MSKSDYKKLDTKDYSVQQRLHHKGIYCISDKWIRWSKKYLSRSMRRRNEQSIKSQEARYEE